MKVLLNDTRISFITAESYKLKINMVYVSSRSCPDIFYTRKHSSFFDTSNLQGYTGKVPDKYRYKSNSSYNYC